MGDTRERHSHSTDRGRVERVLENGRSGGIPGGLSEYGADLGQRGKDQGAGQSGEQLPAVSTEGPAEVPRFSREAGVAESEVMSEG